MKRFSISFTEDEYKRLEAILNWYEETVGVRMSRCAIIKQLLFAEFRDAFAKSDI